MAALDDDSDSELELEEKQFTIGAHTFQVHVVGELPLETLFALESKRDEISGQRAWPGSLLLAAEISARPALVADRAVVELGAGAGLCAMVAACVEINQCVGWRGSTRRFRTNAPRI